MPDNGSGRAKLAFRRAHIGPGIAGADVLALFAGEGWLYRQLWRHARAGATLDKVEDKVRLAAAERPAWACYAGDARRVLTGPWFAWRPFDVVDIDCWGSPWPFLAAWAESRRARAAETLVFLTDGYAGQASIAARDKTLWPRAGAERGQMTMAEYEQHVTRSLRERWGNPTVLDFVRLLGSSSGAGNRMRAWALRYTSESWAEDGRCRTAEAAGTAGAS